MDKKNLNPTVLPYTIAINWNLKQIKYIARPRYRPLVNGL